jgi:hypothetical protein
MVIVMPSGLSTASGSVQGARGRLSMYPSDVQLDPGPP